MPLRGKWRKMIDRLRLQPGVASRSRTATTWTGESTCGREVAATFIASMKKSRSSIRRDVRAEDEQLAGEVLACRSCTPRYRSNGVISCFLPVRERCDPASAMTSPLPRREVADALAEVSPVSARASVGV